MPDFSSRSGRATWLALVGAGMCFVAVPGSPVAAQAIAPVVIPPHKLSWYGDPKAPDISGVWVRSTVEEIGRASCRERVWR